MTDSDMAKNKVRMHGPKRSGPGNAYAQKASPITVHMRRSTATGYTSEYRVQVRQWPKESSAHMSGSHSPCDRIREAPELGGGKKSQEAKEGGSSLNPSGVAWGAIAGQNSG
jgi:hypothetical protein